MFYYISEPSTALFLCLISNFRRVLNVAFLLLGDSPASEFLCADVSEHSVSSIFIGGVSRKNSSYTTYEDGTDKVFRNVGI